MIEIKEQELEQGLDLLDMVEMCPNSHNCLWDARYNLFKIPNALPQGCQKEHCELILFRKALESDSPLFYAESLRLSNFEGVLKTAAAITGSRKGVKKKKRRKFTRRAYDLHIFAELVTFAIYPLFLENKEIPFIAKEELAILSNNFSDKMVISTVQKMNKINSEWVDWIETLVENMLSSQHYTRSTVYLVHLFLKGLEKNQLVERMTRKEKEELFSEIENHISKK